MTPTSVPRRAADIALWIVQAHAGNRTALGELLEGCRRYLLRVANQELRRKLRAKVDPCDLVQDTLLEAIRDFPCFLGTTDKALLGWLRRTLRNNVANVHRHFETDKRETVREIALQETAADALRHHAVKQTETASGQAELHEQKEQLQHALHRLSEHHRQVLFLHTSEGLTFARIAEKLGGSTEAVRKQWGRTVEKLAKCLQPSHGSSFRRHQ